MQHLLKDHVCRLRQEQEADAVQKKGRLELPEAENKHSLPSMSPEGISSRVSLHEMWSVPALIGFSVDYEKRTRGADNGCKNSWNRANEGLVHAGIRSSFLGPATNLSLFET